MTAWLGARVAAGTAVVVGLLGLVGVSWWTRGFSDASLLFQLVQGVILGTIGYLFGTQGIERAEKVAIDQGIARANAEQAGESTQQRTARLEASHRRLERVIASLRADPRIEERIDAVAKWVVMTTSATDRLLHEAREAVRESRLARENWRRVIAENRRRLG